MPWGGTKVTEPTGTTDFFELIKAGTPQAVQAAISNGADVNAQDKYGWTPLMYAAGFNPNPEVIATLLKAGADIEARDKYGATPLMEATWYNPNPEVITTLLKAGADAKAKDSVGKSAFYYAQRRAKLQGTDALQKLEKASK
jgi:ankyrin repeat protein